jgi:hypothetical protein
VREQLDLCSFLGSSGPVPPLLYADDMTLLATSAAGLQASAGAVATVLPTVGPDSHHRQNQGLRLSSSGGSSDTEKAALQAAEQPGLAFAGQRLAVVTQFKHLSILFHSNTCLAGSAAPARTTAAWAAMHKMQAKCAALGLEAAQLQRQLCGTMVGSVLSYGSPVWDTQLSEVAAHR